MSHAIFSIIVVIAILLIVWYVTVRFSPDPLITQIVQILIFLIALAVALFKILPLAGISF